MILNIESYQLAFNPKREVQTQITTKVFNSKKTDLFNTFTEDKK